MKGRFLALACALAVFGSGVARASMVYPPTIASHLGIACVPLCTICHRDLNGGLGTVNKRFGMNLQALYGLTYGNPALLISALDQAAAMHLDSDGDGDTDIDQLKNCRDPNQPSVGDGGVSSGATGAVPPLEFGCAIGRAPGGAAGAVAGLLCMGGILPALRRRYRRAR
jgi:hypothetical protein